MKTDVAPVAIIVLNYRGCQETIECLDSLLRMEYPCFRIFVIDNGSEDESVWMIREYCNRRVIEEAEVDKSHRAHGASEFASQQGVLSNADSTCETVFDAFISGRRTTILGLKKNLGFAGGNNFAVHIIDKIWKPEYFLLLNNDTIVDAFLLDYLVESVENDRQIGLTQAKILQHGEPFINNTGACCDIFGATRHRGSMETDNGQYDLLTDKGFFYANGACVLVSKKLLMELNEVPFDEDLFFYGEDLDLSWNARLLGYRVAFSPKAICHHKEGTTIRKSGGNAAFWSLRNRIRVIAKNYSAITLLWLFPLSLLLALATSVAASIHNRDARFLRSFVAAIDWNARNLRSTLRNRRIVQRRRILDDREVMRFMEYSSLEVELLLAGLGIHSCKHSSS